MSLAPEVIVLGLGGMGSSAAWRLARRGARVRGFDPHPAGHALGSSHGEVRMIRQAYFEHPDYVPLLKSAYRLWSTLEAESGKRLFHHNGVVIFGPEQGSKILPAVKESARLHGLKIEALNHCEASRRYPEYRPPQGFEAVLEPDAGFLEVESAVIEASRLARETGAELRYGEKIKGWRALPRGGVEVETDSGAYRADKLVIAAGAWSPKLLGPEVGIALRPKRVTQFWFEARMRRGPESLPCFGFELPQGFFYGFPCLPHVLKVALHKPGEDVADPDRVDRELRASDLEPVRAFVDACLPEVAAAQLIRYSACMYTMTPDEHFVVDRHPRSPDVVFGAGFSGHGFKFAPVVGEILSDLALVGRTDHPIEFLRLR